jgi:formamidopyrimidine-DNA glycosylase
LPELPEVEAACRQLDPWITKASFLEVELRRPDLRRPFPRRFRQRLAGQTVLALTRRAKYLLATLSSRETLLIHLGMSGSFSINTLALDPHDHVVFRMSSGAVIAYHDPRRFGLMDLLRPRDLAEHPVLSKLGPEPLSAAFDGAALAHACKGKTTSLKAALLDQRVVAGLGNIYVVEALHRASLSPRRRASTIATSSGAPRDSAHRLAAAIKEVLNEAIARQERPGSYRSSSRFRVYDREGEACRRASCGGVVKRLAQGGRSTFYCPLCQR